MRLCHYCVVALVIACGWSAPRAFGHSKEALETFDKIYGKAVRGVLGTRSTADDAKLARILLNDANALDQGNELAILMLEKTYDFGSKHTQGFRAAADALQALAGLVPRRQIEMQEKLLNLYEIVFRTSRGISQKKKKQHKLAGEATVDLMLEIAAAKAKRAEYLDAVKLLTRATGVARAVQSPKSSQVAAMLQEMKPMAAIARRIATAKRAFMRDTGDKAAAEELAMLYLKDLDRPITAKHYARFAWNDERVERMALAGKPVDSLSAEQSLMLGKWYGELAKDSTDQAVTNMLVRSKMYYERFLEDKPQDSGAKLELTKLSLLLAKNGLDPAKAQAAVLDRRKRLGITVASAATTLKPVDPDPKPVEPNPKPVDPKPKPVEPKPKPIDPKPADPKVKPAQDWQLEPVEVEPEYQERKLDDKYWKNRKSIFDFGM